MPTVYIRTIRRTAELLGGEKELAKFLDVSPVAVKAWLAEGSPIPPDAFLQCVDLLVERSVASLGKGDTRGDDSGAREH